MSPKNRVKPWAVTDQERAVAAKLSLTDLQNAYLNQLEANKRFLWVMKKLGGAIVEIEMLTGKATG